MGDSPESKPIKPSAPPKPIQNLPKTSINLISHVPPKRAKLSTATIIANTKRKFGGSKAVVPAEKKIKLHSGKPMTKIQRILARVKEKEREQQLFAEEEKPTFKSTAFESSVLWASNIPTSLFLKPVTT